jgi:quercetin dioxygenase-like cupin family protein
MADGRVRQLPSTGETIMPVIDNSQSPTFELAGVTFTGIAAPSRGSRETAIWRARIAPNTPGVVHHMTREEIIVTTRGEGRVQIGGDTHALRPGDAFAVPAFTEFALECAGEIAFEAMVILPVGGRAVIANEPAFVPPWSV